MFSASCSGRVGHKCAPVSGLELGIAFSYLDASWKKAAQSDPGCAQSDLRCAQNDPWRARSDPKAAPSGGRGTRCACSGCTVQAGSPHHNVVERGRRALGGGRGCRAGRCSIVGPGHRAGHLDMQMSSHGCSFPRGTCQRGGSLYRSPGAVQIGSDRRNSAQHGGGFSGEKRGIFRGGVAMCATGHLTRRRFSMRLKEGMDVSRGGAIPLAPTRPQNGPTAWPGCRWPQHQRWRVVLSVHCSP